MGKNKGILF